MKKILTPVIIKSGNNKLGRISRYVHESNPIITDTNSMITKIIGPMTESNTNMRYLPAAVHLKEQYSLQVSLVTDLPHHTHFCGTPLLSSINFFKLLVQLSHETILMLLRLRSSRTLNLDTNTLIRVERMDLLLLQSPLQNFAQMIGFYLAEIWDFLIFIGQISGVIVVLVGAILWFTDVNPNRGKGLILGGIVLSIVIEYFVLFPPTFVIA